MQGKSGEGLTVLGGGSWGNEGDLGGRGPPSGAWVTCPLTYHTLCSSCVSPGGSGGQKLAQLPELASAEMGLHAIYLHQVSRGLPERDMEGRKQVDKMGPGVLRRRCKSPLPPAGEGAWPCPRGQGQPLIPLPPIQLHQQQQQEVWGEAEASSPSRPWSSPSQPASPDEEKPSWSSDGGNMCVCVWGGVWAEGAPGWTLGLVALPS